MDEPLEVHDVAVVVFATAPGVDPGDAANRLERALRTAMDWDGRGPTLFDSSTSQAMPVNDVVEVNTAARNGYLRVTPTNKARRERPI